MPSPVVSDSHLVADLTIRVTQVAERQHHNSFGQPPPTRRANNTARLRRLRPSCVRCGWSDRLERTEQRPA